MSQLIVTPLFDGCCPGTPAPTVTANPNLFYDITQFADPTAAGLVPPLASLPCTAFELNGNGAIFVWNPANGTWKSN
jgi:hypothetical protein